MGKLRKASSAEVLKAANKNGTDGSDNNQKVHNFKREILGRFKNSRSDIWIDALSGELYVADIGGTNPQSIHLKI